MIEFGLSIELIEIVTLTDARIERILRRARWLLRRAGKARPLGNTTAVAGYLEVSPDALDRIRKAGHISGPALWAPVIRAADEVLEAKPNRSIAADWCGRPLFSLKTCDAQATSNTTVTSSQ